MDTRLEALKEEFDRLKKFIKINELKAELEKLREEQKSPDNWHNQDKLKELNQKIKKDSDIIKNFNSTSEKLKYLVELEEMKEEGPDFASEFEKELAALQREVKNLKIESILSEPDDTKNAIMSIHPGAGGTESQDWAQMLYRMYTRWFERKGFKFKVLVYQAGDEAGLKDVTVFVEGLYAYGYLKAERGVHRLVRISPFDAARRRHTSFASVFVSPQVNDVQITINEKDIKIDTYRSSGPGGQHMQKNDTAVRITHLPSGIVVTCQSERSQFQNKQTALSVLRSKLYELEKEKEREKQGKLEKGDIAWGHQIRSYIMHPYKMVKDHRTNYETGNVDAVMDGDIDGFIEAFLLLNDK